MAPIGTQWMNFAFVNLGFICIILIMIFYVYIANIKKNWGMYKCNPMFMLLSDNIGADFKSCINQVQNKAMPTVMAPVNNNLNALNEQSAKQSDSIDLGLDSIGGLGDSLDFGLDKIENTFSNTTTELQKLSYTMQDMLNKVVATGTGLAYVLQTNSKAMSSIWKGPPGQVMRKLASLGSCFHPDTQIQLLDGTFLKMKDVEPGSILVDGSKVISVMRVDNREPLLKLESTLVDGGIYVSGSHLIKKDESFIKVESHPNALKQTEVESSWYSCLITDTHKIQIGEYIFWDWEDYYYPSTIYE